MSEGMEEPTAPQLPPPSYDDALTESIREDGSSTGHPGISSSPEAHGHQTTGPFGTLQPHPDETQPLMDIRSPQTMEQGHGLFEAETLSSRDFFARLEYKRTSHGYSSSDPWLNRDVHALYRFIREANERPRVMVEVQGSHMEDRVVESVQTQPNGQTQRQCHTHQEKVVDFKFSLELTPFIHEQGTLYTARGKSGEPLDLMEVLRDYVGAENFLKELRVQKKAIWDYDLVRRELINCVRNTGYPHTLDVEFPMEVDRIVVKSDSRMAGIWRHPVTSFLCFVSCACLVGWPIQYFATRRWRNKLMSDFVVLCSPTDFIDRYSTYIRNQVCWSARPSGFLSNFVSNNRGNTC
ncbi:hypothetical protein GGI07_001833 [Coemansia sp. Benny D115]|nr:hypothetical protein GGI07_001833 [Coemansia sp. Benny D115]